MKKVVRLTEQDLHRIVKESVKRMLKEGHYSSDSAQKWDQVRGMVGDDAMIQELWNYLDADIIDDFIKHMDRNYELDLDSPEEEEEFEEDEDEL